MMVSKKNQCTECGTEMEFHFSSGNYVCIKCCQDDRDLVLSLEEKRRIEFREKKEREQKEAQEKRINEEKAAQEKRINEEKAAQERAANYERLKKQGINVNMVQELKTREALPKDSRQEKNNSIYVTTFYMTALENLSSILQKGILSNKKKEDMGIHNISVSNSGIMNMRRRKYLQRGENLLNWCATYFLDRNPMWRYNKSFGHGIKNTVMLKLKINVNQPGCFVTDMNASINDQVVTFYDGQFVSANTIKSIQQTAFDAPINEFTKPCRQAECLIKDKIPSDCIKEIQVGYRGLENRVRDMTNTTLPILYNYALA